MLVETILLLNFYAPNRLQSTTWTEPRISLGNPRRIFLKEKTSRSDCIAEFTLASAHKMCEFDLSLWTHQRINLQLLLYLRELHTSRNQHQTLHRGIKIAFPTLSRPFNLALYLEGLSPPGVNEPSYWCVQFLSTPTDSSVENFPQHFTSLHTPPHHKVSDTNYR